MNPVRAHKLSSCQGNIHHKHHHLARSINRMSGWESNRGFQEAVWRILWPLAGCNCDPAHPPALNAASLGSYTQMVTGSRVFARIITFVIALVWTSPHNHKKRTNQTTIQKCFIVSFNKIESYWPIDIPTETKMFSVTSTAQHIPIQPKNEGEGGVKGCLELFRKSICFGDANRP